MVEDKAENNGAIGNISEDDRCFGTRLSETSSGGYASIIEACMIGDGEEEIERHPGEGGLGKVVKERWCQDIP